MYDYAILQNDIRYIEKNYPFIQVEVIGKTVEGRNIYALRLGVGPREVFYNGAHHGQEWVTAWLLMRFIFDYAYAYANGTRLAGMDIRKLYDEYSIYIVPMVNPDGVEIGKTTPGWQANARGVDLNHNYDALWQEGKDSIARDYGVTEPGPTRYSGPYPESEPESKAIADFTRNHNFEYVIPFHSQGEVIYWKFNDIIPPNARELGEHFANVSGYKLDDTTGSADYSGYKDWFIQEYNRPGFTVEVGLGENPLPESQFEKIYGDVLEIMLPVSV